MNRTGDLIRVLALKKIWFWLWIGDPVLVWLSLIWTGGSNLPNWAAAQHCWLPSSPELCINIRTNLVAMDYPTCQQLTWLDFCRKVYQVQVWQSVQLGFNLNWILRGLLVGVLVSTGSLTKWSVGLMKMVLTTGLLVLVAMSTIYSGKILLCHVQGREIELWCKLCVVKNMWTPIFT